MDLYPFYWEGDCCKRCDIVKPVNSNLGWEPSLHIYVPLLPWLSALRAAWLVWTQPKQKMSSLNLNLSLRDWILFSACLYHFILLCTKWPETQKFTTKTLACCPHSCPCLTHPINSPPSMYTNRKSRSGVGHRTEKSPRFLLSPWKSDSFCFSALWENLSCNGKNCENNFSLVLKNF